MKFLYLVWSNLRRKKLRTSLTLLSILVAFLLYGFLCAIKQAFGAGVTLAEANRLMVRHKVSFIQPLPVSYKEQMASVPGVAAVTHQTWFGGIYQDPKNFFGTFPVDPEGYLDMFPEILVPEQQKKAWIQKRTGAIAGKTLVERFHWKIGDIIALKSPIWLREGGKDTWEFELVGMYDTNKKTRDTSSFFFRYDYFDEAKAVGKGLVGWYFIRVQDASRANEISKKIDTLFENSAYETKTEPEGAMAAGCAQQVGNIGLMLIWILSAVFFTILLMAANTMMHAVRERTAELGVLKAIGFTNERMLMLVLCESCLIAGLGGFLGLGIALAIISRGSPVPMMLPIFYVSSKDVIVGIALVLGLGILAGIIPAFQAMRLKIAEALRREG